MATLYRKYRPQNFKEIVGQSHIKLTLEHEIETGKLAHAYIFCGPRAVGKTTLARVLAKAVNCRKRKEGEHDPCNDCENCAEITAGRNLDIIEIDAASHTGVDNVRENIIAQARVAPSRLKYKIFIIDEVHMLSASAFNALLKVIEEPPATVMFILCTTEIHKVPLTIISRCQRFDFKRISVSDITRKLSYIVKNEKIKIDKEILEAVARRSEGHMRDAESLLGQIVAIGGKEITREEADLVIPRSDLSEVINLIGLLARKDAASALALINKLVDQGVDLKIFASDLVEILRKIMFSKINAALAEKLGLELGETLEVRINEESRGLSIENLILFIEQFIKAKEELKGSFIVQLPIELAIIKICAGVGLTSPLENISQIKQTISGAFPPTPSASLKAPVAAKPPILSPPQSSGKADKPGASNISCEKILEKWNEVLAKVKKYNHSLSFILRVCEPREVSNSQLCLAFKYKFHKDRVSDAKIKEIIEKVLAEVYGASLTIAAVIDEELEVKENPPFNKGGEGDFSVAKNMKQEAENNGGDDMIDNLLKTFGGKVVG